LTINHGNQGDERIVGKVDVPDCIAGLYGTSPNASQTGSMLGSRRRDSARGSAASNLLATGTRSATRIRIRRTRSAIALRESADGIRRSQGSDPLPQKAPFPAKGDCSRAVEKKKGGGTTCHEDMEQDAGRLFVNEQSPSIAGIGLPKAAPISMCDSVRTTVAKLSYKENAVLVRFIDGWV
jgi:hypothetical protein